MQSRILQVIRLTLCMVMTAEIANAVRAEEPARTSTATSSETVKVATIAMHSEMGKPELNLQRVDAWCAKARAAGATFAVFPEECVTGSLNKSTLTREESRRIATEASKLARTKLAEICRRQQLIVVCGTIEPAESGTKWRNNALIISPAGHLATFTKLWLPNHNEENWFEAGRTLPVVTSQGWSFSVGICADIDHAEYFHAACRNGADFMLLPIGGSGMPELVGSDGDQTRQAHAHKSLHMKFLPDRARETGMYLFYANQAGHSGTDWFPGMALAVDPAGKLVDEHLPTEGMTVTTVSRKAIAAARNGRSEQVRREVARELPLLNSSKQEVRIILVRDKAAAL